jgi:NAD(P)-dependent dehydrogenase (short-subunit alcohol dehydrogenase family)
MELVNDYTAVREESHKGRPPERGLETLEPLADCSSNRMDRGGEEPMNGSEATGRAPTEEAFGCGPVLVTGASSGIGRACALKLISSGFRVFAGVRKEEDAQALKGAAMGYLTPLFIDITDPDSVASAAETVEEAVGESGLFGLINNAGVGEAWPLEFVPLDRFRRQFEVNVFGHLAVTQAFLPLIRAATGRIVNVGSVGGRITMPFGGPLSAPRHALVAMNDALRMELYPWGIHVVLIEGGSISTRAVDKLEASAKATIDELPTAGRARYAEAFRTALTRAVARTRAGSLPEVVAEAVLRTLTDRTPKTRYPVGADTRMLLTLSTVLPDRLLDQVRFRVFGLQGKFDVRRDLTEIKPQPR